MKNFKYLYIDVRENNVIHHEARDLKEAFKTVFPQGNADINIRNFIDDVYIGDSLYTLFYESTNHGIVSAKCDNQTQYLRGNILIIKMKKEIESIEEQEADEINNSIYIYYDNNNIRRPILLYRY
jgi:hypothetical protein